MSRADTVGIVGAGRFGLAVAAMLGRAGRPVALWSQSKTVVAQIEKTRRSDRMPDLELPETVWVTEDVNEFAARARFLLVAVSSESVRERLRVLGQAVDGGHIAVHAIGAFSAPTDERVTEVIAQETAIIRTGVVVGPSMAEDIAAGRYSSLVCASEFDEVGAECRRLMSVPPLMRLYRGRDVIGAELASALSGAYTIAIGMADALQVGVGTRGVLLTRAVAEMSRLGVAAGAKAKTFAGLAGLGNLLVRSSVEDGTQSQAHRLGHDLVTSPGTQSATESARAARAGVRMARKLGVHMPVLDVVVAVLDGELEAQAAAAKIVETVAEEE